MKDKNVIFSLQFSLDKNLNIRIPFVVEILYTVSGPRFDGDGNYPSISGSEDDANWSFTLPPIFAADQQTVVTTFLPEEGTFQEAL